MKQPFIDIYKNTEGDVVVKYIGNCDFESEVNMQSIVVDIDDIELFLGFIEAFMIDNRD